MSRDIDELQSIEINGCKQWVLCRGRDSNKPVVLFVHGGPGAPTMLFSRAFDDPYLDDFIVAHWDQRGAGKSAVPSPSPESYNLGQYVEDGLAVAAWLRRRFSGRQIILVGHSWGTVVASHMAAQRPEMLSGLVLVGVMANMREIESYRHLLVKEKIDVAGDLSAAAALAELGAPPFVSHDKLSRFGDLLFEHVGFGGVFHKLTVDDVSAAIRKNKEYSDAELEAGFAEMKVAVDRVSPFLADYDAIRAVPMLSVPVYVAQGTHDLNAPSIISRKFFDRLKAPNGKAWAEFSESAHFPFYEEPAKFRELLRMASRENL